MAKKLQETHFPTLYFTRTRRSQSSSPPIARFNIPPIYDSLLLHGVTLPISVTFQTNPIIVLVAMVVPWGNVIGLLNHGANNDFPRASRIFFPRFIGDGIIFVEKNLSYFHKACGVVNPEHEDVVVKMFVDTLVDNVSDWFQDLPTRCITDWNDMKKKFEE
jgi:hypothetical protein